ncbi:hypothetical protein QBC37DRAFT_105901 [Rhypophila decipiens]|uniref:Uncharacterized protein n=1 Tax=Rhypophila decipiens TaxID=261697 RepID=A0AAN6YCC3_9PEZI|nr:hypothetical protein QBC37DRAFT_105901 [Rhypophila decipiens]
MIPRDTTMVHKELVVRRVPYGIGRRFEAEDWPINAHLSGPPAARCSCSTGHRQARSGHNWADLHWQARGGGGQHKASRNGRDMMGSVMILAKICNSRGLELRQGTWMNDEQLTPCSRPIVFVFFFPVLPGSGKVTVESIERHEINSQRSNQIGNRYVHAPSYPRLHQALLALNPLSPILAEDQPWNSGIGDNGICVDFMIFF